jgi:hypothetical protein
MEPLPTDSVVLKYPRGDTGANAIGSIGMNFDFSFLQMSDIQPDEKLRVRPRNLSGSSWPRRPVGIRRENESNDSEERDLIHIALHGFRSTVQGASGGRAERLAIIS